MTTGPRLERRILWHDRLYRPEEMTEMPAGAQDVWVPVDVMHRDVYRVAPDEAEAESDDGLNGPPFWLPVSLALRISDVLRLAHIYVLKDSHPEELGDDFKPHKWDDEKDFAEKSSALSRELLDTLVQQRPRQSFRPPLVQVPGPADDTPTYVRCTSCHAEFEGEYALADFDHHYTETGHESYTEERP